MLERASRRAVSCRQVDAWLVAYLKGGLPSRRRAALDEHLAGCEACRRALRDARSLEAGLRLEAAQDNPTLSPLTSARIQERVYRRMRRGLIVQRTWRIVGGAAGAVAAVVLVAGALALWQTLRPAGSPEPAGPEGGEIGVTAGVSTGQAAITFAAPDESLDAYRDLAAEFEGLHPNVHVEVVSLDEILGPDLQDSMSAEAALRVMSAADAAWWSVQPEVTRQGLVRNLGPFVDADPGFDAADFYSGLLDAYRWDGGLWAMPDRALVTLLYYDKAAFDEAGVPYPQAGWTWDDFAATAQAVAKLDGDEVARYGYVDLMGGIWESYVADQGILGVGAVPQNSTGTPREPPLQPESSTPHLDSAGVAAAMRGYVDMVRTPGVTPELAAGQQGLTQAYAMVSGGQAAMWTDLASDHPSHPSGASIYASRKIGVVPFPSDGQGGANPVHLSGYVMSAGTTQPEAAWWWLSFLTRQGPVGMRGGIAARRSAAAGGGFWNGLDDDLAAALRYAVEHPLVASPAGATPARAALRQALAAVLEGGQDVDQALAEAQQAVLAAEMAAPVGGEVRVPPVPTAARREDGAVTITFITSLHDPAAYRALAEEFHRIRPDVEVEVQPYTFSGSSGIVGVEQMAAAGDCFRFTTGAITPGEAQYLLNLDPLLNATAGFSLDDYYAGFRRICEQKGQLWCLPYDGRAGVVYYNKALFEAAGIPYPEPGWTLDDLVAKAQALTGGEGADKQYGFSGYTNEELALQLVLRLRGGTLWDRATLPPRPQYDDPAVVDAVRWYAGLAARDGIRPAVHLNLRLDQWLKETQPAIYQVEDGKVAMWAQYAGADPTLQRAVSTLGIVPFPQYKGRTTFAALVEAHYISARTEHPQACWDWLVFLADQVGAVTGVPVRRSVAESAAFQQLVGTEAAAAYLAAVQPSDPALVTGGQSPWMAKADHWFYAAYDAVLDGADAAQALGEAQRLAEAYVLCLAAADGFEDQVARQSCALEVDPAYPVAP